MFTSDKVPYSVICWRKNFNVLFQPQSVRRNRKPSFIKSKLHRRIKRNSYCMDFKTVFNFQGRRSYSLSGRFRPSVSRSVRDAPSGLLSFTRHFSIHRHAIQVTLQWVSGQLFTRITAVELLTLTTYTSE